MTAAERTPDEPHPLRHASPAVVRDWLLPDDRARFSADYQRALDEARTSFELAPVHKVVEHWRRIAIMQLDPAGFRETVRRVAELATGEPRPVDEPFEITREHAGV